MGPFDWFQPPAGAAAAAREASTGMTVQAECSRSTACGPRATRSRVRSSRRRWRSMRFQGRAVLGGRARAVATPRPTRGEARACCPRAHGRHWSGCTCRRHGPSTERSRASRARRCPKWRVPPCRGPGGRTRPGSTSTTATTTTRAARGRCRCCASAMRIAQRDLALSRPGARRHRAAIRVGHPVAALAVSRPAQPRLSVPLLQAAAVGHRGDRAEHRRAGVERDDDHTGLAPSQAPRRRMGGVFARRRPAPARQVVRP